MDIYVENWHKCPFRFVSRPKEREIELHCHYQAPDWGKKYPAGRCKVLKSKEETPLHCPRIWITNEAKRTVGVAPHKCPLKEEIIIVKPGPNSKL